MSSNTIEDVESALEIIEANGGDGEWESAEAEPSIQRWSFPRFLGAEATGTCESTEHDEGTHTCFPDPEDREAVGFVVDPGNMYLSRAGSGPYDTDVETIVAWMSAPRNVVGAVLLLGEPGTGKTALVEAAATHADASVVTHVCTPDDTRDSLMLRFVGEGKGEILYDDEGNEVGRSAFTYGSLAFAAKHGHWWYGDEAMLLQDGVKPVLYPAMDGRRFLPGGEIDNSPMEIHPDFRVILSSNPQVRGASLPEPIASRCASTTLTVDTSAAMLRDLGIDDGVVAAWEALGNARLFRPAIREIRLADYWLGIDPAQAVSAFLPEHCPESDRAAVRDLVVSLLGGDIRADGRLVVS